MGAEHAAPDGFYQAPLTVTDKVEILDWSTEPFEEPTEMIGTGAAHLFVEIDQPDTNSSCACGTRAERHAPADDHRLPQGLAPRARQERTTEGSPSTRTPARSRSSPGQIEEYVVRLYPFATTFLPGHRLVVELSNDEPLADEHNALLPPDAFHLPVGRPVTHKVYRDAAHPSRLVLPYSV